jgi:hypothetical protein
MHVDKIEDKVEVLHKDKDESKGRGKVIGKDGRYKPFYDRFGG